MPRCLTRLACLFSLLLSAGVLPLTAQETARSSPGRLTSPLPPLLVDRDGERIDSPERWLQERRPEILDLFRNHVYGRVPEARVKTGYRTVVFDRNALGSRAVQKEVEISVRNGADTMVLTMLMYLPTDLRDPVPLFLGLNFYGNQTIHPDPQISLARSWLRNNESFGITAHTATEASRGVRSSRWPVELILSRGYGLATIYYGDMDPDRHDGFTNGIHGLFPESGQPRDSSAWGSISAWAWGLSRAMDYFLTDPDVDASRVALIGHSRLGKTALWAGALDERFALVISNNSGCGGAALSRRDRGESVKDINTTFPHWFASRFHFYNQRVGELPVDQHMLLSLIAPRPLYVASAVEDRWADPFGEYLALFHAGEVYRLFGQETFRSGSLPPVDEPRWKGNLGYHIRSGPHDLTRYDWEQYLDFADRHMGTPRETDRYNPVDVRWIRDRLEGEGPRLILTPEVEGRIRKLLASEDPVAEEGFGLLRAHADMLLELEPVAYEKRGRRLLGVSREALKRLTTLALVSRIDRNRRHIDRLEAELAAVCSFRDWNPSHFLDVAEMATGIAFALDWAGEYMSPSIRRMARKALVEKAIGAGLEGGEAPWVRTTNNWNLVCHGGLSLAALAVFEEVPRLSAEVLQRAVEMMPRALEPYAPDGIYPEGPSYWSYATSYLAAALSAFESALHTDFGFSDYPGIMESATFSRMLAGPSGDYFNFFDAGLDGYHSLTHHGLLAWFAIQEGEGLDWQAAVAALEEEAVLHSGGRIPRLFGMHLIHMLMARELPDRKFVPPSAWAGRGDQPLCIFRDRRSDPEGFFLAAKGGRAADSHGNMDAGSFVFESGGIRWSVDPGNQPYYELEERMGGELWNSSQGSGRWQLLTKNNFGHSTLTVNGKLFRADARAELESYDLRGAVPSATFDLTPLYGSSVSRAVRTFSRHGAAHLRITDRIRFSPSTERMTWQLLTRASVIPGKGGAILEQGGKRLKLVVRSRITGNTGVVGLDPPPYRYDKRIPGLKRVEIAFDRDAFPEGSCEVVTDLIAE